MRGMNIVVLSGNVVGELIRSERPEACSFLLVSMRKGADGKNLEVVTRINVYARALLTIALREVGRGSYVTVRGELMNREVSHGRVTEVRAHELYVTTRPHTAEESDHAQEEGRGTRI